MSTLDILLIAGIIITPIITWLIQRIVTTRKLAVANERLQQQSTVAGQLLEENKTLQTEKENLIQQAANAKSQLQFLDEQYTLFKRYQKENEILTSQLSMFKAKFQAAEERLEDQKKDIEQIGEHFKSEFKNLAQAILNDTTDRFMRLNEEKMNTILYQLKNRVG